MDKGGWDGFGKSLLFGFGVTGAEVAGLAVTASKNPAGWAYGGLMLILPVFFICIGAAWLLIQYKSRFVRGLTLLAVGLVGVGYPAYWLYCLIWVTTDSWRWATVAAACAFCATVELVAAGIMGARHKAAERTAAVEAAN